MDTSDAQSEISSSSSTSSNSRYIVEVKHKAVKAGQTIAKDIPIVYTLMPGKIDSYCFQCLKAVKTDDRAVYFVDKLNECSECKKVNYCSSDCKSKDVFHKVECKIFKSSNPPDTYLARLALRFLIMIRCGGRPYLEQKRDAFKITRVLNELETYTRVFDEDSLLADSFTQTMEYVTYMANEYFPEHNLPTGVDIGEIEDNVLRALNHSYKLIDSEGVYAVCLYLRMTLFSHSCKPNSIAVIDGTSVKIRSVKRIGQDEPITICYADPFDEYDIRHKSIRNHAFECECKNNDSEIAAIKKEYKEIQELVDRLRQSSEKDLAEKLFKKWINLITLMSAIVPHHQTIIDRYFEFLISMTDCDNLAEFPSANFFYAVKLVYGKYHPIQFVLLECLTLACEKPSANKKLIQWKKKLADSHSKLKKKIRAHTPKAGKKLRISTSGKKKRTFTSFGSLSTSSTISDTDRKSIDSQGSQGSQGSHSKRGSKGRKTYNYQGSIASKNRRKTEGSEQGEDQGPEEGARGSIVSQEEFQEMLEKQ